MDVCTQQIIHIKGSDLEYQTCNITPVEVQIAIRQRKFNKKLFDLAGETAVGVVKFLVCYYGVIEILVVVFRVRFCSTVHVFLLLWQLSG